jgi:hypothetical protein
MVILEELQRRAQRGAQPGNRNAAKNKAAAAAELISDRQTHKDIAREVGRSERAIARRLHSATNIPADSSGRPGAPPG